MKKRLAMIIAMALLCMSHFSHAQLQTSNWKFSNPKKFGFTVLDVSFIDNNNGIAVGASGGIAKTSDAGVTWQYAAFTYTDANNMIQKPSFAGVHFVTPTIAYAVGNAGLLAKSTDGGLNWTVVNNPLFPTGKSINTVYFLNKDTGYIGGQANGVITSPKLYFTKNGGATWDSLLAPVGPKTRIGYINNPSRPAELADVTSEQKEIHKIIFVNDSVGYIAGSGSNSLPYTNTTGGTSTTGGGSACLVWKFKKGVLTDYSISKERTGYAGINTTTVTATTLYNPLTPSQQTIKALRPLNDSVVVVASFNNAIVVRIKTGVNDSTENIAQPGTYMKGKYEMLNYPFPPLNAPSIPAVPVLPLSNMNHMDITAGGALIIPTSGGQVAVSTDQGTTWTLQKAIAPGAQHSNNLLTSVDVTPNGRVFVLGMNGVAVDSIQGSPWGSRSNHTSVTFQATYEKIKAADCNNIIAAGGGQITVTTDGGNTWIDKVRQDFVNSFINFTSLVYNSTSKLYLGTSHGYVYSSADQATTLDPIFADPYYNASYGNGQITALAAIGNDRIWAFGYRNGPTTHQERTMLFRSFNAGNTWDTIKAWPLGTNAATITEIDFPNTTTGYAAGGKGRLFKTTDAGATWTDISPFAALNTTMVYTDIQALDANTIFVTGNAFPRKVVYRSTDGGTNWTDISPVFTNVTVGNFVGLLMHDANSGYVTTTTGMLITTNGGANWTLDQQPGNSPNCATFVEKTFPPGTQLINRRVLLGTLTFGNFTTPGGHILEYGNAQAAYLSATESVTNANCTNANGGSIIVNTTGALAPYTYSLNNGTPQSSNTFSNLAQGTYSVTIRDAGCQSITRSVTIGFTNNLTLTVAPADTLVCAGAPVTFRTTANAATYAWSPATGLSNAAIANPVATVNANTTYTLTASLNGCTKTAQATIRIKPGPVVNAGPDKTVVNGYAVQLNGSGNNVVSIAWTPNATLTDANTFTPTARPTTTTTYTLTVKNTDGCTSTDEATVTVLPYCLRPMNAFTPNGDGFNDLWLATQGSACAQQVSVKIYNRYGGVVYANDHYQNDWNGVYKGKPVADGTYYYVVTYKTINGNNVTLNGDVTILR